MNMNSTKSVMQAYVQHKLRIKTEIVKYLRQNFIKTFTMTRGSDSGLIMFKHPR